VKKLHQIPRHSLVLGLLVLFCAIGVFGPFMASAENVDANLDQEWRVSVNGLVTKSLNLSLSELAGMPKSIVHAELYCYGNLVSVGDWGGVKLGLLLEEAGVKQQAVTVEFNAKDGYRVFIPLADALRQDVIVAYEINGQLLSETLRLVIPDSNGNSWISMITEIRLSDSISSSLTPIGDMQHTAPAVPTLPRQVQTSSRLPVSNSTEPKPVPVPDNSSVVSDNSSFIALPENQPNLEEEALDSIDRGYSIFLTGFLAVTVISATVCASYVFCRRKK